MLNINDESTDKLFQEGADRYEFAYKPEAWEQMEQLLDREVRTRRRRWWLGGLFLLTNLIFAVWYFQTIHSEAIPPAKVSVQDHSAISKEASAILTTEPQDESFDPAINSAGSNDARESATITEGEVTRSNLTTAKDAPSGTALAASPSTNDGTADPTVQAADASPPEVYIEPTIAKSDRGAEKETRYAPSVAEDNGRTTGSAVTVTQDEKIRDAKMRLRALPLLAYFIPDDLSVIADRELEHAPDASDETAMQSQSSNGLFLSAGVGSIFGNAGKQNFTKPQERVGLQLGYRFGQKFGLQLGGFYNGLTYTSPGKKYKADENFWTDGIIATAVEADCRVVEIPLLLSYHLNGNASNGFYLSGGLTSYFFLREEFAFDYDSNRDDLVRNWREDNTNRHLFGYGQFNLGYEKRLGTNTALQVESFVQVPLNGIGHGKVNLYNVGISASLLFDFRR